MTSLGVVLNGGALSWGELLARERKNHTPSYTQQELARRCGVELRAVEAWERNERVPSGQALGRLYGSLASMRRYGVQLYELRQQLGGSAERPLPAPAPAPAPAPPPPDPPAPPAPPPPPPPAAPTYAFASYGQALAWARLGEGFHQTQLATLLGGETNQYDISRWERDEVRPTPEQQERLVALGGYFAALANAPPPTGRPKSSVRRSPTSRRDDIPHALHTPVRLTLQTPPPQPVVSEEPPMAVHAVPSKPAPTTPAPPPATGEAATFRRFLAASRALRASEQKKAIGALLRSKEWAQLTELVALAAELGMPVSEVADEVDR